MISSTYSSNSVAGTLSLDYRNISSSKSFHLVTFSQKSFNDSSFNKVDKKNSSKSDFANQLLLNSSSVSKNHPSTSADALSSIYSVFTSEPFDDMAVYRGLVLDFSYRPVNVVCWKRALCLDILDKADVLQYYDQVVRSASQAFQIPAVLRMSSFVYSPKQRKRVVLSRNNILIRDKFRCQYCSSKDSLTIDHVKAVSKGGKSNWENLVTACFPCNSKKGDKSPAEVGMKLRTAPKEPNGLDFKDFPSSLKVSRTLQNQSRTPPEWQDWLPIKSSRNR